VDFFGDFNLRDTFQERIAPKSVEIDKDKLNMKFLALNIHFDGQSLDFLVQGNLCTKASNSSTPVKVIVLPLLASLLWKRLQITVGMLPIITSTSDELFSRIKIDDFKRPWTFKIRGFIDLCDLWLPRTFQEWTATKWLAVWQFANRNCYKLSRVLWALAKISCSYLVC